MHRKLTLTIVFVLLTAMIFGCGPAQNPSADAAPTSGSTTAAAAPTAASSAASEPAESDGLSLPLTEIKLPIVDEPLTLEVFVTIDQSKIGVHTNDYNGLLCYQELERLTGIHIEFLHPSADKATEQFNLMLTSGDLPDMVYWNFLGVAGGPEKAIDDGLILDLKEYYDNYSPNLTKFLNENPAVRKEIITDTGKYYCYPYIQHEQIVNNSYGYMARADWMEKLGLDKPVTIDDWYNFMVAMRDGDPNGNGQKDEIPLLSLKADQDSAMTHLMGAWGVHYKWYQENGQAKYGPAEPGYKDWLLTMRQWIEEGLIDPDFASQDQQLHDSKFLNGQGAICREGLGSGMDRYIMGLGGEESVLTYFDFPVMTAGETPKNFQGRNISYATNGAAISATSEYPAECAMWLDFHYGEQGHMILNFGVEGVTYNMIDGYPQLVDSIINDERGVSVALGAYATGASWDAFLQDARVREQRLLRWAIQRETCDVWNASDTSGMMPPVSTTGDESEALARIMSEITTYVNEATVKFLLGREDIEAGYDKYIETIKGMKLDEAVAIQNAAVTRYYNR